MIPALAAAFLVGALLILPPGYLVLFLCRSNREGLSGLVAAIAAGYTVVLALFAIELAVGVPALVLPAAIGSLLVLRFRRAAPAMRPLVGGLAVSFGLGALALGVAWNDVRFESGGLAARLGFDVTDRPYYSMISQELFRSPIHRVQNPMLAGQPLQYALFPALLASLLQKYAGLGVLFGWWLMLPALGLAFTGLAVAAFFEQEGRIRWRTALLAVMLVVLGGGLSFAASASPPARGFERTAHFLTFYAFSAESLTYNPWMFALPVVLAGLAFARRYLGGSGIGDLVLCGLVLGALVETKPQAGMAVGAGAVLAAAMRRDGRLAELSVAVGVGALPWLLVSLPLGAAREGPPLVPAPLSVVASAIGVNPPLGELARLLGTDLSLSAPSAFGAAIVAAAFLAGGLGVRLAGIPRLARSVRADPTGFHALVASACGAAVILGMTLKGNPADVDGWQFLFVPQYLLWLYVAPALHDLAARSRRGLLAATGLVALALVSPVKYLAQKVFPERWTAPGSADRLVFVLPQPVLDASSFLARQAARDETLLLPLRSSVDPFGLRTVFVAALSGLRVPASVNALHATRFRIESRQAAAERIYTTGDAAEAEALLDGLGVAWVWEEPSRPLGFASPRLELRYDGAVRLWRVHGPGR